MVRDLEARLRSTIDGHVPGVAVAVVDAGGVRATAGVGMADLAGGRPASPEMVCMVLDDEDRDGDGRHATRGTR
jgi:hypothetical protein